MQALLTLTITVKNQEYTFSEHRKYTVLCVFPKHKHYCSDFLLREVKEKDVCTWHWTGCILGMCCMLMEDKPLINRLWLIAVYVARLVILSWICSFEQIYHLLAPIFLTCFFCLANALASHFWLKNAFYLAVVFSYWMCFFFQIDSQCLLLLTANNNLHTSASESMRITAQ